jgi:hypothetical protein
LARRQLGESLDPVTYALIDPDDAERTRAQGPVPAGLVVSGVMVKSLAPKGRSESEIELVRANCKHT